MNVWFYSWWPQDAKDDETTRITPSSPPLLVARTSTHNWEIWEKRLALEIHAALGENKVDWSNTNVVRIGYADEYSGEIILWIEANPRSLSHELDIDMAQKCKKVLLDHSIGDIEVEIRESKIFSSAGPHLLEPGLDGGPMVDLREPFTHSLGITICSRTTPWTESITGFFLEEGGEGKRLFLVTARHVVPPGPGNDPFERKSTSPSQAQHDVLILSDMSFRQHLDSVKERIDRQDIVINYQERHIKKSEGGDDDKSVASHTSAERVLGETKTNKKTLKAFHKELSSQWGTDNNRILGYLIFSPPIAASCSPERFTRDVAVIGADSSEVGPSKFRDNFIDLGNKFSLVQLTETMYPNAKNSHNFDFPWDHLLLLCGTVGVDKMRKPTTYDQDGERCLLALKNGRTMGPTIGRADNIFSFTWRCFSDDDGIAMEWSILPFDDKSGPFSAKGNSGSIVADGVGRIGGILTGGGSALDFSDVAYATSLSFVSETIHSYKPLVRACPKGLVCLGAALAGSFPALGLFPSFLLHFMHLRPFSASSLPMQVFYEMFHVGFQRCNFILSAPSSLEPVYFPFRIEIILRSCVSTRA